MEVLKNENKDVQELITKYFPENKWLKLPEHLQLRYLRMFRSYFKVERFNEEWAVTKPNLIEKKDNTTDSEVFKRPKTPEFKIPIKKPKSKSESKPSTSQPSTSKPSTSEPSTSTAVVEKRNSKRNIPVKNYFEETEPDNDRYIFCDNCQKDYVDYCSKCGMLICLEDNIVPMGTANRARKTVPTGVLEVKPSNIHGLGVFALKKIQKGVRMGPYEGNITKVESSQGYAWKLKYSRLIDASDETNSNYLRYVNCATNVSQQNVIAYQYKGELYYRTFRDILEGEELLVYYGSSFAKNLGIDTKKYFEPVEEETQPDYYSCKFCKIGLSTKEYRNTHEKYCKFEPSRIKKVDIANVFVCKYCKAGISSEKFLLSHEKRCLKNKKTTQKKIGMDSTQKNFKCNYCDYVGKQKENLMKHIEIIHKKEGAKMFHCKQCDFKSYYKGSLYNHKIRHERHPFVCTSCSKEFLFKLQFDGHILKNHSDQLDCITSNINYCDICSYKTLNCHNLTKHLFTHTKESKKKYSCSKCKYSTNDKSALKTHLLTHNDIHLYICTECKKGFNQKNHLDSHIISKHFNNDLLCNSITNKMYTCELCKYKCTHRSKFKNHLSTHTGQKSHFCLECKQGFIRKYGLDSHILNNHKNNKILIGSITSKIHSCNVCSFQTVRLDNFKTHLKTHAKKV